MKIVDTKTDPIFGTVYRYEHEDYPVRGWEGSPFVNFSAQCQGNLPDMDTEICIALTKADLSKYPIVSGVMPPRLQGEFTGVFENEVMYNFSGNRTDLVGMNPMERRKFLFFKYGSSIPWFFILDLKPNMFSTKHRDLNPWTPWAQQHLPYTISCIERMPFTEIGRVVIYGSWPESRVPCHRDEPPSETPPHHINFNPGGYRPVYVYDSISDTKIYLPEQYDFYAYNVTDYHGVDALPKFSYTVRVDGTLTQQALNQTSRTLP